ncbi:MAG: SDR family oxidoreductase [Pseudomonadales bacterium]
MFDDQVVVVTGGAGALGQAVVEHFGSRGARVVAVDYSATLLTEALGEQTASCQHRVCDLTDREACRDLTASLLDQRGRIDVLCNIAGGFQMGEAVHETSDATWNFLFDLNTKAVIYMTQNVIPAMVSKGFGKVINVGAVAANRGQANMGAYLASKAATERLTESLAEEVRHQGVNVNCVLPSVIDTPKNREDMPDAQFEHWVPTSKLADVIGFLASDAASAVHGAAVPVRGLSA